MRIEGTLTKWNDDRGFGFISVNQGEPEVFVHISAFPKDGNRPSLGERLTFEIELDKSGKKRAKNLLCPDRSVTHRAARRAAPRHPRRHKSGLLGRLITLVFIAGLATYGYSEYSKHFTAKNTIPNPLRGQASSPSFQCDGRTHCSEMTSCSEATFFLRNCPGVKMDGDYDGIPCERQLCSGG